MQDKTVLVIESDPSVLHYSISFIEDASFATFGAECATTATPILEQHPHVEAAVVDFDAPGSGALLRLMQQHFPRIRLAVTGTSTASSEASLPPGSQYFQKPFRPSDVTAYLQRAA